MLRAVAQESVPWSVVPSLSWSAPFPRAFEDPKSRDPGLEGLDRGLVLGTGHGEAEA